MKHTTTILVPHPVATVATVLADLETYPAWNDVVVSAQPSNGTDPDHRPAWLTTLTARVGPFARSKSLRLELVDDRLDEGGVHHVRFARHELDDRSHADWIMSASVSPDESGSSVALTLEYDGGLWTGALDPVLGAAIDRATRRLPAFIAERQP